MKILSTNKQAVATVVVPGKQYSYHELVEYLDSCWSDDRRSSSLSTIRKIDKVLDSVSKKLNIILVAGTNGKSLTTYFTAQLLHKEGLSVGAFYSPHFMIYNERFACNGEFISHKLFTDIGNEVIHAAEQAEVTPHALDLLVMMAFVYFAQQGVDVAICEVTRIGAYDPFLIATPKVSAVTRITDFDAGQAEDVIRQVLAVVAPGTHVVSADQSKLTLSMMEEIAKEKQGIWAMPIRKLVPLAYPFEQLHGRSAALSERVAQIYVNNVLAHDYQGGLDSLLVKRKGQRGRPTLEAKRQLTLRSQQTLEQFWREAPCSLPGRFQLLDKEKVTVLLDTASNIDAINNLLLGVRLLHYRRPLKGFVLILGNNTGHLQNAAFIKQLRYFFKKMSGSVIICPVLKQVGMDATTSWDHERVANDLKSMKIKTRAAKSLSEAVAMAEQMVDDRHGLIVVAGSTGIVSEYWMHKGMKRL